MKAIFLVLLTATICSAQDLPFALATEFDDSFRSWRIYTEDEAVEGTLKLRWDARNDWTEWEYRLGESFGGIKQKWRNNPNEWELRGDNRIVRMQTVFPNDVSQWRVTSTGVRLNLRTRSGNRADEWELRDVDDHGAYGMYSTYPDDPRDWEIVDELDSDVPFEIRMALAFLVVYNSTPNE